jgi:polyvinyl alcohol dehydrogenase (cytochrome)
VTPAVSGGRLVFGDQPSHGAHAGAHLLAVAADTGALLWNTVVDTQSTAKITGSPVIDGNTVYLGMSSGDETSTTCCHFRGSVIALDAGTGKVLWRRYTVPVGYTGGAVWGSAPVVDAATNLVYVGTGNNYTVPAGICTAPAQTGCRAPDPADYVDSLLALDKTTGKPVWALRTLNTDVWTKACTSTASCGPDFDFGSSPNLFSATIGGVSRRLVGIGQKSGVYWAVDAKTGALQWQTKVGPGGAGGGIQWGSAVDAAHIYVSIVNSGKQTWTLTSGRSISGGAFSALDPATGRILWQTADPQGAGDFGFVSSANGIMFAGSGAGTGDTMYALDGSSGSILWEFASGGSVMGGAAIVDGIVYWASGYYTKSCPAAQPQCGNTYRLYAFWLGTLATAPTGLGSSTTGTSAVLSWSPPSSNGGSAITGYRVARDGVDSHGSCAWSTIVPATARTQKFNSLLPGHTYHLTVQAINAVGTGPAATATITVG